MTLRRSLPNCTRRSQSSAPPCAHAQATAFGERSMAQANNPYRLRRVTQEMKDAMSLEQRRAFSIHLYLYWMNRMEQEDD